MLWWHTILIQPLSWITKYSLIVIQCWTLLFSPRLSPSPGLLWRNTTEVWMRVAMWESCVGGLPCSLISRCISIIRHLIWSHLWYTSDDDNKTQRPRDRETERERERERERETETTEKKCRAICISTFVTSIRKLGPINMTDAHQNTLNTN